LRRANISLSVSDIQSIATPPQIGPASWSLTHAILAFSAAVECDHSEVAESSNAGRYQADGAP
jgi:hypothetical protein